MGLTEKLLIVLCVFGLLYAVFLVFLPKPPVYYSVLYLMPGHYGTVSSGEFFARFGIQNHESRGYDYETSFFIDALKDDNSFASLLLAKKEYFVEKDETFLNFVSFKVPKQLVGQKDLRFRIQTSAFGTEYSVHFWLKK